MGDVPITVVMPVGPFEGNLKWLPEAIESINRQTLQPSEIIFINDGAWNVTQTPGITLAPHSIYTPPWRLGVGHAFNFGIALSPTECVFMMGSDDLLHRNCLEHCYGRYLGTNRQDGYYWVPVHYLETGQVQHEVCNAAMVTKRFWSMSGGFPIEATTAPDAALNSIMMTHPELRRFKVSNQPLYYYRSHDDTDTRKHGEWMQTIIDIRNHVTREWTPPKWTKNFYND